MKNRNFKKIISFFVAVMLIAVTISTPYRAFAFSEEGLSLNIDTVSTEVKNAWAQIKNAAIIHLVAQKMQRCVGGGHVLSGNNRLPAKTSKVPFINTDMVKGVVDRGSVFNWTVLGGDIRQNIAVGPWMSNLFKGQGDGVIQCNDWTGNDGNLFNMFVYVLKNYRAGMKMSDLENPSVSDSSRLDVICNKGDLSKPGLLVPSDSDGNATSEACNDPNVKYYTGVSIDEQNAYLKSIYEEMRENSNNDYILAWDDLGQYDAVDGYYLYSKDFSRQCGSVTFNEQYTDGALRGYSISEEGLVREGYYIISGRDPAIGSFAVGGGEQKTCKQLITRMNELIKPYLQKVNYEVYKACKTGIDEAIERQKNILNDEYLGSDTKTDDEKADAQSVLDEYNRIRNLREYTAITDADGNEELKQAASELENNMPTDYIWTCRSHLPFVDVVVQEEDNLADAMEDEFYDACYDAVDLAWVVCPIINGLTGITDALNGMIEGFF